MIKIIGRCNKIKSRWTTAANGPFTSLHSQVREHYLNNLPSSNQGTRIKGSGDAQRAHVAQGQGTAMAESHHGREEEQGQHIQILETQQPGTGNYQGSYWGRGRGGMYPRPPHPYYVQQDGFYRGRGRGGGTHVRWDEQGQFRQQGPSWRTGSRPPPPFQGNNAQFIRNPLFRSAFPPRPAAPFSNTYGHGGGYQGQENWRGGSGGGWEAENAFTPHGHADATDGSLMSNQFHFQQSTYQNASGFQYQNFDHGFFHQQHSYFHQSQQIPFSNSSGLFELRDWENRGGNANRGHFSFRSHPRRLSLDLYSRKWEQVQSTGTAGNGAEEIPISVMCYNVLAPTLLRDHQYLYKQCDPSALAWSYRKNCFFKEIETYAPDVVCLQEVEADLLVEYDAFFQGQGYSGVFKKRTNDKCDGCAIYYRDSKFNLVDSISVEYYQKSAVPLLDRDNIGILVKLETNSGVGQKRHKFVVATTHLLFNPKRDDVKIGQTMLLLAELDRMSCYSVDEMGVPSYYPTIVTGDFNIDPNHTISQLISEGSINVDNNFLSANDKSRSIPSQLLISPKCQHSELQNRRQEQFRTDSELNCELHSSETEAYVNLKTSMHHFHSEDGNVDLGRISHSQKPPNNNDRQLEPESESENGTLSHAFNFRDVYGFSNENAPEDKENFVTTQHKRWVRVDFIYYSTNPQRNQSRREEGNLKLLRRLKLPTRTECESITKIPREGSSSDHFPLMAEFLLS